MSETIPSPTATPSPAPGPRITIRENGPYRVEGDIPLFDHLGNQIQPPKPGGYSLCRCGASNNRPFCDKTHSAIGFIGARAAAQALDQMKAGEAKPEGKA